MKNNIKKLLLQTFQYNGNAQGQASVRPDAAFLGLRATVPAQQACLPIRLTHTYLKNISRLACPLRALLRCAAIRSPHSASPSWPSRRAHPHSARCPSLPCYRGHPSMRFPTLARRCSHPWRRAPLSARPMRPRRGPRRRHPSATRRRSSSAETSSLAIGRRYYDRKKHMF